MWFRVGLTMAGDGDGDFRDAVNQFMGAIREFRESTERRLDSIDGRLDEGNKTFQKIAVISAKREGRFDLVEERIGDLEKKDVLGGTSRTEKIFIAFAAVGNALKWVFDIFF